MKLVGPVGHCKIVTLAESELLSSWEFLNKGVTILLPILKDHPQSCVENRLRKHSDN